MRRLILFLTLWAGGWAQETIESLPDPTEEITPEPIPSRPKPSSGARLRLNFYIEVAYNRFLGLPAELSTTAQALGSVKFNFQPLLMLRIGKAFYCGAGSGLAIREVRFEKNAILYRDTMGFLRYSFDTLISDRPYLAKSKFQLGYLRLPLEVGILHRGFQLAAYGYADILAWVRQKRKYVLSDESTKLIQSGNQNFGTYTLQYGVGARIGYRSFGFFANYNLSPLWRSSHGPANVRAFQTGLYLYDDFYIRSGKKSKKSSLNL